LHRALRYGTIPSIYRSDEPCEDFESYVGTCDFGEACETYLHHEILSYLDYTKQDSLHYWRSTGGYEVDFILNGCTAIEVKSKSTIGTKDLKGVRALKEEQLLKHYCVVYTGEQKRITEDNIHIYPLHQFLTSLWDGAFSS
jgi:uncharacterized protein